MIARCLAEATGERKEKTMKKGIASILVMIGLLLLAGNGYAQDRQDKDASMEKKWFRNYSGEGSTSVSSFCIEGYVFIIASGDTSNSLALLQVYEERKGKVVPKKCP